MSLTKVFIVALFTIFLTGCSGMPLLTAYKLRHLDPLQTDPAMMSIGVITDKSIQLSDRSAFLELGFTAEDNRLSLNERYEAVISEFQNSKDISTRIPSLTQHQHLTLFELTETDAQSMRVLQGKIHQYRADNTQGNGYISVSLNSGCFTHTVPERLLVDIYVKFSDEQGYLPMTSRLDLLEEAKKAGTAENWLNCANNH